MPKGLIVLHGKLMKLSYGPGQKSFGRWCNIRNYLRRLDALIKWGHLLQSTSQFSLLPTFKMLYSEKFWIHLSNVVFEVGEGLGMCDLTKKKKRQICPKSFARDCRRTALVYRSFYIHPLSQGWTTDRLDWLRMSIQSAFKFYLLKENLILIGSKYWWWRSTWQGRVCIVFQVHFHKRRNCQPSGEIFI